MQIQVVATTPVECSLDATREFGILLTKALSIIHMVHWYAPNYDTHVILGDLYDSLDDLFDKLQEEIIGTSKLQNQQFPSLGPVVLDLDYINQYRSEGNNIMDTYTKTYQTVVNILSSLEFTSYVDNVRSGLNNTKEEVFTSFNKANYLLSLVKI
jgi:hypothetical protein